MTKMKKKLTNKQMRAYFSTEKKAEDLFIEAIYGGRSKIHCPRCGCTNINLKTTHPQMPWRCRGCRKYFSIRTGTVMESSKLPLSEWAEMAFEMSTELRSRPAKKIMSDYGHTYQTAWFMNHRLRKAYENNVKGIGKLRGKVQVDETAVGGKARNMSEDRKRRFKEAGGGTGFAGKEIIVAAVDERGKIIVKRVEKRDKESLQGFVNENVEEGSTVVTDEVRAYRGLVNRKHLAVNHSANQYVRGEAHVNGVESFWSTFKHGIEGSFYKVSPKHVERYANEFAARQGDRKEDTIVMVKNLIRGMAGVRLKYEGLIEPNGLSNFARPVAGSVDEELMFLDKETRRKASAMKFRRYKVWKAWKAGEITPETNAKLSGMIARKKARGKWEDRIPY